MKRTFVAALIAVLVLGLAGVAFANPYSDVPTGHWAYDAVNELAKAGIMGDSSGKFNGNQTLTRYEMATIVARVMAKSNKADDSAKALVDKLAVEFSAELDSLGLRVIAEGVETEGQKEILRGMGCDVIQGFLMGKAMPADDARRLLHD